MIVRECEKHADFLRDFRGDTVHPSTLEVMRELGLLEAFMKLRHRRLSRLSGMSESTNMTSPNSVVSTLRANSSPLCPSGTSRTFSPTPAGHCRHSAGHALSYGFFEGLSGAIAPPCDVAKGSRDAGVSPRSP